MEYFFSSRRRHTRDWRDWSSDVCSSDLEFRIDQLSEENDDAPSIAMNNGGSFVVAWQSLSSGAADVFARRLIVAAVAQTVDRLRAVLGKSVDLGGCRIINNNSLCFSI